jgi:hypothetical protein
LLIIVPSHPVNFSQSREGHATDAALLPDEALGEGHATDAALLPLRAFGEEQAILILIQARSKDNLMKQG